jgi:hypothetical protein
MNANLVDGCGAGGSYGLPEKLKDPKKQTGSFVADYRRIT